VKKNAERGLRIADLQSQSSVTPKVLPDARAPKPEPKPSVDSVNPQSVIRNPQSIELHIEELVIDGFAPDNTERFAAAVESELTRLLSERGIQGSLTEDIDVERLAGGALRIRQDEQSETTGRRLARTIYTGMIGGLR
jgi:hypothetical protein